LSSYADRRLCQKGYHGRLLIGSPLAPASFAVKVIAPARVEDFIYYHEGARMRMDDRLGLQCAGSHLLGSRNTYRWKSFESIRDDTDAVRPAVCRVGAEWSATHTALGKPEVVPLPKRLLMPESQFAVPAPSRNAGHWQGTTRRPRARGH